MLQLVHLHIIPFANLKVSVGGLQSEVLPRCDSLGFSGREVASTDYIKGRSTVDDPRSDWRVRTRAAWRREATTRGHGRPMQAHIGIGAQPASEVGPSPAGTLTINDPSSASVVPPISINIGNVHTRRAFVTIGSTVEVRPLT